MQEKAGCNYISCTVLSVDVLCFVWCTNQPHYFSDVLKIAEEISGKNMFGVATICFACPGAFPLVDRKIVLDLCDPHTLGGRSIVGGCCGAWNRYVRSVVLLLAGTTCSVHVWFGVLNIFEFMCSSTFFSFSFNFYHSRAHSWTGNLVSKFFEKAEIPSDFAKVNCILTSELTYYSLLFIFPLNLYTANATWDLFWLNEGWTTWFQVRQLYAKQLHSFNLILFAVLVES